MCVGGMGHAISIANGIAINKKTKVVFLPVPNIPVDDTPTHPLKMSPIKRTNIILIFIFNINTIFINYFF